jgi:hypothetical protein
LRRVRAERAARAAWMHSEPPLLRRAVGSAVRLRLMEVSPMPSRPPPGKLLRSLAGSPASHALAAAITCVHGGTKKRE